jgi:hypothetical protein
MRNVTHTDKLGRVAEDLAIIKLSTLFEDCIVSQIVNNQLHDIEIRKRDEPLTKGICRIQVKSTNSKGKVGGHQFYLMAIHHGGSKDKAYYGREDADFFLFYVFPEGKFYVVPNDAVKGKSGTKLYVGLPKPKQARAIYEKYLEAWGLIADFLGLSTTEGETIDTTLAKF